MIVGLRSHTAILAQPPPDPGAFSRSSVWRHAVLGRILARRSCPPPRQRKALPPDACDHVHSLAMTTPNRLWILTACVAALAGSPVALLAQLSYPDRCGTGIPRDEKPGYAPLPRGDVFCQLIADPKSPRSFATLVRERIDSTSSSTGNLASVGIGDVFPLGRWDGATLGDGVQLSLSAGVFAQFDLGTQSYDLLNADYMVGIPLTIRRGRTSMRLRIYHQSSHLGDEYLLREPPARRDRENLSFESVEGLFSLDAGAMRVYGGGEMLINREPSDLSRMVVHAGAELRPMPFIIPLGGLGGFRFLAATDVKSSKEHDWQPSVSARVGLEYDRARSAEPAARRWALLLEYYDGPSPYGQFFREQVRYTGIGVHFSGF